MYRIKYYPLGYVVEQQHTTWYGRKYWKHYISVRGMSDTPWYFNTYKYALDSFLFEIQDKTEKIAIMEEIMTEEEKIELVTMLINNFTIDEVNRLTELLKLDRNSRELKLMGLLEIAICPTCDGSGAIQTRISEWEQCQWCDERIELLNKD